MEKPILYRKRIIPDECILLKDDTILSFDNNQIRTSWSAIHPKKDLHHGYSLYLLSEGIKISKFCHADGSLLYWYCDIVSYQFDKDTNILVCTDLLADVIIYPDGFVKVVDLDELVCALQQKLLSQEQLSTALLCLNKLLQLIYTDQFKKFTRCIDL